MSMAAPGDHSRQPVRQNIRATPTPFSPTDYSAQPAQQPSRPGLPSLQQTYFNSIARPAPQSYPPQQPMPHYQPAMTADAAPSFSGQPSIDQMAVHPSVFQMQHPRPVQDNRVAWMNPPQPQVQSRQPPQRSATTMPQHTSPAWAPSHPELRYMMQSGAQPQPHRPQMAPVGPRDRTLPPLNIPGPPLNLPIAVPGTNEGWRAAGLGGADPQLQHATLNQALESPLHSASSQYGDVSELSITPPLPYNQAGRPVFPRGGDARIRPQFHTAPPQPVMRSPPPAPIPSDETWGAVWDPSRMSPEQHSPAAHAAASAGHLVSPYGRTSPPRTAPVGRHSSSPVISSETVPDKGDGVKKKRKRADANQLRVLNAVYNRTAFPTTEERHDLARQLDMQPRSVQIWFQNKRQAARTNRNASNSLPPIIHIGYSSDHGPLVHTVSSESPPSIVAEIRYHQLCA